MAAGAHRPRDVRHDAAVRCSIQGSGPPYLSNFW